MQVKIIEPIREYSKVFNTPDEFNIWYSKNKDEVDALTTHKLNKMYKIEGYRITKIKNVLMLKKDCTTGTNRTEEECDLKEEVAKIKDAVNQIIAYLNMDKQ